MTGSIRRACVVDQGEILYRTRVELPISDALAIGAPAEAVTNIELFFINPIRCSVDDLLGSV